MSCRHPLRVVVVHWNQPDACVGTVSGLLDGDVPVRVTVVDNASDPHARNRLIAGLASLDGSVEVISAEHNMGFGPGANVGLRRFLSRAEDGEWVALMPHDVEVSDGCLDAVFEAADTEPMAGLMCADVGDGMVPVIDPYFGGMAVPADESGPARQSPHWEEVDYPHGTLMFLRRACLEEVGLFDERFFSYCEEADLALRVRRAGWRVGLVRGALVRNQHLGSTVALVDYLQTRNTLLLVREMSGRYHAFIRACITVIQVVRGLRDPARRPPVFDARARMSGLRDFVLGRFGPPPGSVAR